MTARGDKKKTAQLDQMLKDACSRPGVAEAVRVFDAAQASTPASAPVATARLRFATGANQ